jgi:hypothetical protein
MPISAENSIDLNRRSIDAIGPDLITGHHVFVVILHHQNLSGGEFHF